MNLEHNKITDKGLTALTEMLKLNYSIIKINLNKGHKLEPFNIKLYDQYIKYMTANKSYVDDVVSLINKKNTLDNKVNLLILMQELNSNASNLIIEDTDIIKDIRTFLLSIIKVNQQVLRKELALSNENLEIC